MMSSACCQAEDARWILWDSFNKAADAAIDQIKRKHYPAKLEQYAGNLLHVGINYDKETKTHSCRIEKA